MAMLVQQINKMSSLLRHRLLYITSPFRQASEFQLQPLLIPASQAAETVPDSTGWGGDLSDALWFAVPKKKVTRSKKRMKTTSQKRIKLKKNIITDPRTGEYTLMHKLPFNWKEYLPK